MLNIDSFIFDSLLSDVAPFDAGTAADKCMYSNCVNNYQMFQYYLGC